MRRFVAKRMGATTTEVESSHVAMLSKPSAVIDVIKSAAAGVPGGPGATKQQERRPSAGR